MDSNRGSYDAPVVVNCAGTSASRVGRLVGVEIPLDTWTHEVAFVKRPPQAGMHPTVIDDVLSMYFRPEGELTLVALEHGNRMGEAPEAELGRVYPGFVMRAIAASANAWTAWRRVRSIRRMSGAMA